MTPRPTIVIAHMDGLSLFDATDMSLLAEVGEVLDATPVGRWDDPRADDLLRQAEVIVGHWGCPPIDLSVLDRAPRLGLVAHAAGTVKGMVLGMAARGLFTVVVLKPTRIGFDALTSALQGAHPPSARAGQTCGAARAVDLTGGAGRSPVPAAGGSDRRSAGEPHVVRSPADRPEAGTREGGEGRGVSWRAVRHRRRRATETSMASPMRRRTAPERLGLAIAAIAVICSTLALVPTAASAAIKPSAGCTQDLAGRLYPEVQLDFLMLVAGRWTDGVVISTDGWVATEAPFSYYPNNNRLAFYVMQRNLANTSRVTYGRTTVDGRRAFCVNWTDMGSRPEQTNDAQLLIVDRSDIDDGDFDVIYNYGDLDYVDRFNVGRGLTPWSEVLPQYAEYIRGSSQPGAFNPGGLNDLAGKAVTFQARGGILSNVVVSGAAVNNTISFDTAPTATYGSPDRELTATATSGLPVDLAATGNCTLSGSTLSFGGLGTCTVTASQGVGAGHEEAADVVQVIEIVKLTPAITLTDLTATYDGTPHPVTVAVDPVDAGTVTVTYDGDPNPPVDAGSYLVTATVEGDIHHGTTTGTLTIAKAAQTLTVDAPQSISYGSRSTVAWRSDSDSDLPVVLATQGPCDLTGTTLTATGVGTCTITANQPDSPNHLPATPTTVEVDVVAALATMRFLDLIQFEGPGAGAEVITNPFGLNDAVTITYYDLDGDRNPITSTASTIAPTTPGTYQVVATFDDTNWVAPDVTATFRVLAEQGFGTPGPPPPPTSTPTPGAPDRTPTPGPASTPAPTPDLPLAQYTAVPTTTADTVGPTTPALPRTGTSIVVLSGLGLLLVGAGMSMRRAARRGGTSAG